MVRFSLLDEDRSEGRERTWEPQAQLQKSHVHVRLNGDSFCLRQRHAIETAPKTTLLVCVLVLVGSAWARGTHPRDGEIGDADIKAWWHAAETLLGGVMQGCDTGSAAYRSAPFRLSRLRWNKWSAPQTCASPRLPGPPR